MTSSNDSPVAKVLRWLAGAVYRHPHLFLYPQILLFGLGVLYVCGLLVPGHQLEFDTKRRSLVGADKKYHQLFLKFREEFGAEDDMVVAVESESLEKNRQFVERLGARLAAETNLFTDIFYRRDPIMLGRKALLFIPEDKLRDLAATLKDYQPFIQQFTNAGNLSALFDRINTQFRTAKREANDANTSMVKALPVLERLVNLATDSIQRPGDPPSPGVTALFGAGAEAERAGYITFGDGRIYLVTSKATTVELEGRAVERLRELTEETRFEVPGVNAGVTGESVLEKDEMKQSQSDSTTASIVSLVLCALIFIYAYRETGRPLKAVVCLVVGIGYTMTYTTLVVGHLNILTITFVPILIGLAIDFGVHLVTRYEEELRLGRSEQMAMEKAMVNTGLGIFTGALTTSAAFFAMGLTDFKGIREMGTICGGGLMVCFIPMMTMLPVLLLRGRQNQLDHSAIARPGARLRIERWWLEHPVATVVATVVISAGSVLYAHRVSFDYNLLNMQSRGLPAVVFSQKLIDSASKSVLFGAVIVPTAEEAMRMEDRLTKLPSVAEVDSMGRFLAGEFSNKLPLVRGIKADLEPITFAEIDPDQVDLSQLSQVLWSLMGYCGITVESLRQDDAVMVEVAGIWRRVLGPGILPAERVLESIRLDNARLEAQLGSLREALARLRVMMLRRDPVIRDRLTRFQQAFLKDVRRTFQELKNQDDSGGLEAVDLPASLRNRFIGVTGRHLLQVYPKKNVWERGPQEEFVRDIRKVAPDATGTPFQLYEYTTLLKESYQQAAWYALAAIALMVLIHFRSATCLILALFPVGLGFLWMVGLMGLAHIPFNPANIMTLPLVIGIGVTNGIHILNRFAEEQSPGILGKSTGKAVLVSGLNTVAGFGSLILAKHQGIASLGFIMSVGVSTCMIAALTFLPALLVLMIDRGWRIKKPSDDNARSPLGSEEPR